MGTGRLEAFSDGVIAILITIMVLELKIPESADWQTLKPMLPVFLTYILSYIFIGIYWTNHHHMLHAVKHVNGGILWANLHLLFWLSLIPFVTGWMGRNHYAALPTAVYGAVLLMAGLAWSIMQRGMLRLEGPDSRFARAIGSDTKGNVSLVIYLVAIPSSFVSQWIADGLYVTVAMMWLVPDRRIEAVLKEL